MNLTLLLALALLAPTTTGADVEADADAAREAYRANRFVEAAAAFEALWGETRQAKYLYNAGLAREGVGHDTRAVLHWQRFLAQSGVGPEEAAKAETRLRAAILRTTPVPLHPGPADALADATLLLERSDDSEPLQIPLAELRGGRDHDRWLYLDPGTWKITLQPGLGSTRTFQAVEGAVTIVRGQQEAQLTLTLAPIVAATLTVSLAPRRAVRAGATLTLREAHEAKSVTMRLAQRASIELRPGRWSYIATAPGFREKTGELEVVAPQMLELHLERDLSEQALRDRRQRLGLGLGLGLGSVASAAIGGVVYVASRSTIASSPCHVGGACLTVETGPYSKALNRNWAATGLMGSAGGLLVGAVSGAFRAPKRVWLAELGVGVPVLLGGVVTLVLVEYKKTPQTWEKTPDLGAFTYNSHFDPLLTTGAVLAGIGAGLATSAITGLIARRKSTNPSSRALGKVHIRLAGARIHAEF